MNGHNVGEYQYLAGLQELLEHGDYREGRNGGVYSLFGHQMKFQMSDGFPLLTTKRVHHRSVFVELLWFIAGRTDNQWLNDRGVTIWDEWAHLGGEDHGDLGPIYGYQWRKWPSLYGHIDQLADVIAGIKNDPYGRRHIVNSWNVAALPNMALPPCHCLYQFHVTNPGKLGVTPKLNLQLYQRSADWFLGVPFNIASYALLLHLVARECDLEPGEFIHTFGDYHLYENHVEQAKLQLSREPRQFPKLIIDPFAGDIFNVQSGDIWLEGYEPHQSIKAEVSA